MKYAKALLTCVSVAIYLLNIVNRFALLPYRVSQLRVSVFVGDNKNFLENKNDWKGNNARNKIVKVGECALLHLCSVMILLEITVCDITPFRILSNRIFSRSNYTYIFHLSSVLQHHLQNNGTHAYCPRKTDLESSRNIHNHVF